MQSDIALDPTRTPNDYIPRTFPWSSAEAPHHSTYPSTMTSTNYGYAHSQLDGSAILRPNGDLYSQLQSEQASYDIGNALHQQQYHLGQANGFGPSSDMAPGFYPTQYAAATNGIAGSNPNLYQQFHPHGHMSTNSITEHISSSDTGLPSGGAQPTRSTLRLDSIELWMDVEYFNQVCGMMGWENVILKIPSSAASEYTANGKPLVPNNPGHCFLTFPTPDIASTILADFTPPNPPTTLPNSKRPFNVTWASVPASSARSTGHRANSTGMANSGGLFAPGNLSLLNPFTPSLGDEGAAQQNHSNHNNSRQQEFSIFVGDLAPETTNSDLIAVFRDPILGLKHDREPKFVAPFTSCRSAKIMVDPVMGVSKGYGFVRFGSASDASRALIEMQGLYCLSRPMRISQATAKARTLGYPSGMISHSATSSHEPSPSHQFTPPFDSDYRTNEIDHLRSLGIPAPTAGGVSTGLVVTTGMVDAVPRESLSPTTSTSSSGSSRASRDQAKISRPSSQHSQPLAADPLDTLPPDTLAALSSLNLDKDVLNQLLRMAMLRSEQADLEDQKLGRPANDLSFLQQRGDTPSQPIAIANGQPMDGQHQQHRGSISTGHAASRSYSQSVSGTSPAIQVPAAARTVTGSTTNNQRTPAGRAVAPSVALSNGGGALNSTDPYNTTVFVGGLSGLISEETLRTFFGPFGDIHYVKIPPGKGCGFVQFVRKADAELAIEKMQGFPIGGGRVRLSWGRSQYKAAQAAAQAAELGINIGQLGGLHGLSEPHAAQLLQSLGLNGSDVAGGNSSEVGNAGQMHHLYTQPQGYNSDGQDGYGRGMTASTSLTDTMAPGAHLSRSQTFPTFAPFGSESSTYSTSSPPTSRSTVGVQPPGYAQTPPVHESPYTTGPTNRQSAGQMGGFAYFDGSYYRGSSGFQVHNLLRQERSGSDSTAVTSASDKTPPPQKQNYGADVYDIGDNMANLHLGQGSSFDMQYRPTTDVKVPIGHHGSHAFPSHFDKA